jgi:hypothetical protein
MTIPEEQLPCQNFSRQDAILVTDSVQVEFLKAGSNASFRESLLLPLSANAYAAILKLEHPRVRSYFDFIDFLECKSWYRNEGLECSKRWLRELGLEFQIEGIDLADLDVTSQNELFLNAVYLNGTAERMIRAHPEIETFYIVVAEQRLPLDYYFDSDVPAAVLRFVCERLGRLVRAIIMNKRPRYVFPWFSHRPVISGQENGMASNDETPEIPKSSRPLLGFAPSTVSNHQQIHDAIRGLGSSMLVYSFWGTPQTFYDRRPERNEHIHRLSAADGEWSTAVSEQLVELRRLFFERRSLSTVPSCIIRNPHLDFQFDYIFTRRWLSYANMIQRAVRFVAKTPLDLFIHSDCFTPAGAILARLYRRKMTRVIVTLHSGWPVHPNWASWDSSDSAMVPSKSCADRIRKISGMSDVFITGPPTTRTYRSLMHGAMPIGSKRGAGGHRKVVLLLTNGFETNCFPFAALDCHFETLSFIRQIPESLKDRVFVVVRTKPGVIGDDPILYKELCGFSSESLTFLDGLDLSQSLAIADCVVGINLATTGYFQVMRRGVPLIHVQTADVVTLEPDLPPEIVQPITELQRIWPVIEAVLFDERHRRKVLEVQGRFVAADFKPSVSGRGDPIETLFRQLLSSRTFPNFKSFLGAIGHRVGPRDRSPSLDESCLPCCEQGGDGYIEDVLLSSDGSAIAIGWAADMAIRQPARAVHVFLHGLRVSIDAPWQTRSDVAVHFNERRLERSGFAVHLKLGEEENVAALSVYAEMHDGTFFKLQKAEPQRKAEQNG